MKTANRANLLGEVKMQATEIIKLFGGVRRLVNLLGHTHHTTVQYWNDNNRIPVWRRNEILKVARKKRINLSESDFC